MQRTDKALVDIDTPAYGYFQALYLSFYSRRLYVDVGKRWKGFGILYTLLLLAILTLPMGIKWSMIYQEMFVTQLLEPINLIPKLTIQNGNLIFDKPMPFFIKNSKGEIVTIIDASGEINTIDNKKYPQLFTLITKNNIQFKSPNLSQYVQGLEQSNSVYTFDKNDNEIFDPQVWGQKGGLNTIKNLTSLLVYPLLFSLFTSLILTLIPVMALLGTFFSTLFFKFTLTFKQACRLIAVASTPAQLLFFIVITFYNGLTGIGIPLVALVAAYFCFALVFLKKESKQVIIQ